ncbi:radical SAM protein [Afifella sp. YEN Y35]|uniref:radical SAM protein n=1 Tax=Afifella sp. YEN Y35 TaxID=3388337 RepID=UPI0039E14F8D
MDKAPVVSRGTASPAAVSPVAASPVAVSPVAANPRRLVFAPGVKAIRDFRTGRFALFNDCEVPVSRYLVFDADESDVLALRRGLDEEAFRAALPRQAEDYLAAFDEEGFFAPPEPAADRIRHVRRGYDAAMRAREKALHQDLEEKLESFRRDGTRPWSTFAPPDSAPFVEVSLLITDACNLRCRYCHVMDNAPDLPSDKAVGVMSEATLAAFARTFVDYIRQRWGMGCLNVVFFGGQPSLKGKVRAFLCHAAAYLSAYAAREKIFIRFAIDDNGTQIDDDLIAFFKAYDVRVALSFDPPVEVNDWQRPFPGHASKSGRTVENGLRRLLDAGVRVGLRATVSDQNQSAVRRSIETYAAWGLTAASFIPMQDVAHGRRVTGVAAPDPAILKREYLDAFEAVLKLYDSTGRVFDFGPITSILHRVARGGERQTCGMGDIYFAVDPTGRAFACHRDLIDRYLIGDVAAPDCARRLLDAPLRQTCPQVTSFYDPELFCEHPNACAAEAKNEISCAACPILAFCGGSCPAASLAHYGCTNIGVSVLVDSDPARGTERCRFSRELVEELFWHFIDEPPASPFRRYCTALFGEVPA